MSKKGYLSSLIIAFVVTLALSIYTIVSVCMPAKPVVPTTKTISLAFRNGENVDVLAGYSEQDKNITFTVEEGKENPLEFNAETKTYQTKDMTANVSATVTEKSGNKIKYEISVYHHNAQGLSEEEPFVVASKAHLQELAGALNATGEERVAVAYVNLVSDVDLEGINWIPLGRTKNELSGFTFKGNGHTISNMKINVNENNYNDFLAVSVSGETRNAHMDLGFFGVTTNYTKISDVNFKNAEINITASVYDIISAESAPEGAEYDVFSDLSIGVVVGTAMQSEISNVNVDAKVNGFTYAKEGVAVGMGGVVGTMELSQIDTAKVELSVVNNIPRTQFSKIGGIVGQTISRDYAGFSAEMLLANKNFIENCEVKMSVSAVYSNGAYIGGIVGGAYNTSLKNSVVHILKVTDPTVVSDVDYTAEIVTRVAGAVGYIQSMELASEFAENTELKNAFVSEISKVSVEKIDVTMLGGIVSGFVSVIGDANWDENDASRVLNVVDSSVQGSMTGCQVSGFVDFMYANAVISYTDEFTANAVNVNINAPIACGFVVTQTGKVLGNEGKVKVIANIVGQGANFTRSEPEYEKDRMNARDNTYATGFAGRVMPFNGINNATIKNVDIEFNASNALSYAGVAFVSQASTIENVDVKSNVISFNYNKQDRNYSTTYVVSGAVGYAYAGTKITNMNVVINANTDVDKTLKYGASFFGGVVARVCQDDVKIDACNVSGNAYFNDGYYVHKFGEEPEATVFLAGGIVGSFSSKGNLENGLDGFETVSMNLTTVENCNVNGLVITYDVKNTVQMGSQGYRIRAIGAMFGSVNASFEDEKIFDLGTNTVVDFAVNADRTTFTYGYTSGDGTKIHSTLGLGTEEQENEIIRCYGYGYNLLVAQTTRITAPKEMTNVVFTQI